jgi:inositol phosphorylceramide mannosyltransferase catalytic subunit
MPVCQTSKVTISLWQKSMSQPLNSVKSLKLFSHCYGGLGNQMFQVAFSLELARAFGRALHLQWESTGSGVNMRDFKLSMFGLSCSRDDLARNALRIEDERGYTKEMASRIRQEVEAAGGRDVVLKGYFQNERLFEGVADEVRAMFALAPVHLPEAAGKTPVCVQVRRGDFVGHWLHDVCTADYFLRAVALVRERIANPHFIVICGEMDWCRDVFHGQEDFSFYGKGVPEWDYPVMYGCKAFIISNSTYGWWPAWWTQAELVIHPDRFLNGQEWDIWPKRWMALPADVKPCDPAPLILRSPGFLINRNGRKDRLEESSGQLDREGLPWERVAAVEASRVRHARGYSQPGYYAQSVRVRLLLRRALRERWPAVFFYEDDVMLANDTLDRLKGMELPGDWDFFYLGCVHVVPALAETRGLVRCARATTAHAFGVNRKAMRRLLRALSPGPRLAPRHLVAIDQVLARLHGECKAYTCFPNLAWQRASWSDLEGRHYSAFNADGSQNLWVENTEDARRGALEMEYEAHAEGEEVPASLPAGRYLFFGKTDLPGSPWEEASMARASGGGRLPYPERSAALLYAGAAAAVPEACLREYDRVLRPGGVMRLAFSPGAQGWSRLQQASAVLTRTGFLVHYYEAGSSDHEVLKNLEPAESGMLCLEAEKSPEGQYGSIPRIFHAIWLGPNEMPESHAVWMQGWRDAHPDWEFMLWTDENLPLLQCAHKYHESRNYAQRSDILRFEVLYRYGGVYLDTDMECLQPLDGLIAGLSGFTGLEKPDRPAQGIVGAARGHPFLRLWLDRVGASAPFGGENLYEAGPPRTADILREWLSQNPVYLALEDAAAGKDSGVLYRDRFAIFHQWVFYPYFMHEPWVREHHPHSYAVHHWAGSWLCVDHH